MDRQKKPRISDVAAGSAINGVINGLITWSEFRDMPSVPLSMDSIGHPGVTALGNAVMVAFALTLILTCITFFVFRGAARKLAHAPVELREMSFIPSGISIAIANTLLVFGAFVAIAVIWQRLVGTIMVEPLTATILVALVAAVSSGFAQLRTQHTMQALALAARSSGAMTASE